MADLPSWLGPVYTFQKCFSVHTSHCTGVECVMRDVSHNVTPSNIG